LAQTVSFEVNSTQARELLWRVMDSLAAPQSRACPQGHKLFCVVSRPGERGCDACGVAISAACAHHCEECDYDLCVKCYTTPPIVAAQAAVDKEADGEEDEEALNHSVALHDAHLAKLRFQALLQERAPPRLDGILQRYEDEINSLMDEVRRLNEENTALALRETAPAHPSSRSATLRLCEQARELQGRRTKAASLWRRTQADEHRLRRVSAEMEAAARTLRDEQRRLGALRSRHAEATELLQELVSECERGREEIEAESRYLRDLNGQALFLRDACRGPAQLKKQSTSMLKCLDQAGGRLRTERHARSLQSSARLYDQVATRAPALQPLAWRAKEAMNEEFDRYRRLSQSHEQCLRRLHLAVARGVTSPPSADMRR